MTVDIFIRTYRKDIEWLTHALRSIHKHVTGYRSIIVTAPYEDVHLLSHLTAEKIVGVQDMQDGYLGQQLTKINAWKITDADAIAFWDSDVIATCPLDLKELFVGDKPILYKTRYESIPGCPWQPITQRSLGWKPEFEYMRRMPLIHIREALMGVEQHMEAQHGMSLHNYLNIQPHRAFSEFNTIGAYAAEFLPHRYHIVDTETAELPPCKVEQFWSWGGVTPEVEQRIKSALK